MNIHTLLNSSFFPILIVIVVIAFFLYRQLVPRKISMRGLVIIPLILGYFVIQSLPSFHPSSTKIIEIALSSVISAILGILSCRQLVVYEGSTGKAMAKSSWTYFLWWLAAIVIKSILSIIFGETSFSTTSQTEVLIPILILITTRSIYLYGKVKKLNLHLH